MKVASIIIANSSREIDREFDYYIPNELEEFIKIGSNVIVPFGMYNNYTEGYVINIKEKSELEKLKKVADISEDELSIDSDLLKLAWYIKDKYLCTLSDALKLMLPPKKTVKQVITLEYMLDNDDLTKKLTEILSIIKINNTISLDKLRKECSYKVTIADILTLSKKGCITYTKEFIKQNNKKEIAIYFIDDLDKAKQFLVDSKRAKKQIELVEKIIQSNNNFFTLQELTNKFDSSSAIVNSLVSKEILTKTYEEVDRSPIGNNYSYSKVELTDNQKKAIDTIINNFKYGKNINLIHGVTGCGKTEIYLNLVEQFINEDYGAIVMVPEIALTPQTVERFKGRFGDTVAILHSRLSDGERYDQYRKIKNGEYKVVVGARSAVFAPVKDLKLIVIDEEHEYSYKSESSPRYLTKDIAKYRINQTRGILVLGSATPSIDSYYKAQNGEYSLITIGERVKGIKMPKVKVVNMKEELLCGNKSMFSRQLYNSIKEELELKNQIILFLNRRGYSTFVSCRSCGYVCECESCSVTLTYHRGNNKLKCHYCGREYEIPNLCPKCKSKYIKYFGVGTEKVQKEVEKYFPHAKILRMDVDTTRKKGSHEEIYQKFKNKEADILIGTQMVSKGMDFENVTLVGVISADITLNIPDFRAPEKTFQLLTQVAGRAGRGEKEGKVVVQTYTPEHYAIQCSMNHDYNKFYNIEIENRKLLNNPPFSRLIHVVLASEDLNLLEKNAKILSEKLKYEIKSKDVTMLGPSPCHVLKVKDKYRWHIIFKGNTEDIKNTILDLLQKNMQNRNIGFMIDVDPYTLT